MKTVLILGANGGISQAVAQAFLSAGWTVKGLVRSGKAAVPGVIAVAADLFDTKAVLQAVGAADVVFNGLNVPYPLWPTHALPLYRAGCDVAEALGARHIYPGSVYNFGANMSQQLTPDVPFAPTTIKGRIRTDIEVELEARAQAGRLRTILIRAGDVFGGIAKNSWMGQLVGKDLKQGRITAVGGYDVRHAWAYLPDLADAIVRLAEVEARLSAYEVFHFEGHNLTTRELAKAAEVALGRKVHLGRMPRFVFTVMGWFDPFMRSALEMLYLWDVPHGLYDDRLETVIGPLKRTPPEQALNSLI